MMRSLLTTSACLACLLARPSLGDDLLVPDDFPTIQDAIFALDEGDVIVLTQPGTYSVGNGVSLFGLNDIAITSVHGPEVTLIDTTAAPLEGISIESQFDVLIEGVGFIASGVAIAARDCQLTLTNCRFESNTLDRGPGMVQTFSSDLNIDNCHFEGNTHTDAVSGVCVSVFGGSLLVGSSSFINNTRSPDPSGQVGGAAILVGISLGIGGTGGANATILDSTFIGNSATNGGAINAAGSELAIDRCLFLGNTASLGGALSVTGLFAFDLFFPSDVIVNNSFFSGNIVTADGPLPGQAGAVAAAMDTVMKLINNTFYANITQGGVGGVLWDSSVDATIANCLFASNDQPDMQGAGLLDAQNNLTGAPAAASLLNPKGDDEMPGTADDQPDLVPGAAAIDAGHASYLVSTAQDVNLDTRLVDDPSVADTGAGSPTFLDIGAAEFQGAQPCNAADLAPPLGVLDFSDVVAFLGALSAMDPVADLAPPMGVWDFSDVVAFLAAFGAGCP